MMFGFRALPGAAFDATASSAAGSKEVEASAPRRIEIRAAIRVMDPTSFNSYRSGLWRFSSNGVGHVKGFIPLPVNHRFDIFTIMKNEERTAESIDLACGTPLSRREFVRHGGRLIAGAALGLGCKGALERGPEPAAPGGLEGMRDAPTPPVPRAVLGKTGAEVSVLGLGTGSLGHQNQNEPDQDKLQRIFGDAIDRGITYVDTAPTYGGAQKALRQVLRDRRGRVFLATKIHAETAADAEILLDRSLAELGTDHVDLLHLHNLGAKDVDKVLGKGGSWEYFLKAKEKGKTRFVGLTGHERPAKYLRMLETGTVDAIMVVMNFVDRHTYGFEEMVLPAARARGTGVMAMKVFGGLRGGFQSYGSKEDQPSKVEEGGHEKAIAYIRSLEGVAGMVIGVFSAEQVLWNIRAAAASKPLPKEAFEKLCEEGKALAPAWGPRLGPPA